MTDAPTVPVTDPSPLEGMDLGIDRTGSSLGDDAFDEALAVTSSRMPAGSDGPPRLVPSDMEKLFRVVEGVLRITVGDVTTDVPIGGALAVPAGMSHSYCNPFDRPVAFLTIMSEDVSPWLPAS